MSYEEKGTWVYLVTSAGAYVVYLVPVLTVFLWPSRKKAPAAPAAPAPNVVADVPAATTTTPATPEKPQHARA